MEKNDSIDEVLKPHIPTSEVPSQKHTIQISELETPCSKRFHCEQVSPISVTCGVNDLPREFEQFLSTLRPTTNWESKQSLALPKGLTMKHRSILVDWICGFCSDHGFYRQTFHLCISLLDSYLRVRNNIPREEYQYVGVAVLGIAVKYIEKRRITLVGILRCSGEQVHDLNEPCLRIVKSYERDVLASLDWHILRRTRVSWISTVLHWLEEKTEGEWSVPPSVWLDCFFVCDCLCYEGESEDSIEEEMICLLQSIFSNYRAPSLVQELVFNYKRSLTCRVKMEAKLASLAYMKRACSNRLELQSFNDDLLAAICK